MNPLHRVTEEERLRARCERLSEERDAAVIRARKLSAENADLRARLRITEQVLAGPNIQRRHLPSDAGPPDLRLVKP